MKSLDGLTLRELQIIGLLKKPTHRPFFIATVERATGRLRN